MREAMGAARAPAMALALVLALVLAGCADGYPSKPALDAEDADRVVLLERALAGPGSQVRSVARPAPCALEVRWHEGAARRYDLLRLDTVADTDPSSGLFTVALLPHGEPPSPLLLASPDWAAMLSVRSAVNHLRADCALERED